MGCAMSDEPICVKLVCGEDEIISTTALDLDDRVAPRGRRDGGGNAVVRSDRQFSHAFRREQ